MAQCEKLFVGKSVHLVAVVSSTYPLAEVKAAVEAAGLHAQVLLDADDALYGKLEVRQHPLLVVTDDKGKVALSQPYVRLRYCDIVHAHVRYLLKEIDAAQLQLALNPPAASMPNDDKNAVARRWVIMGRREAEDGHCDRAVVSFQEGALDHAQPAGRARRAGGLRERHAARRAEALTRGDGKAQAFSAAPSRSRSHRSAKEMPRPAAIFGTSEVAVMPGRVFTSRMRRHALAGDDEVGAGHPAAAQPRCACSAASSRARTCARAGAAPGRSTASLPAVYLAS